MSTLDSHADACKYYECVRHAPPDLFFPARFLALAATVHSSLYTGLEPTQTVEKKPEEAAARAAASFVGDGASGGLGLGPEHAFTAGMRGVNHHNRLYHAGSCSGRPEGP